MPWLGGLVADISSRKPRCQPEPVHVRLVVDKRVLLQILLSALRLPAVDVIPPNLNTRIRLQAPVVRKDTRRKRWDIQERNVFPEIWERLT
jgi:hypothetical protein